jgi:hypothetical protein
MDENRFERLASLRRFSIGVLIFVAAVILLGIGLLAGVELLKSLRAEAYREPLERAKEYFDWNQYPEAIREADVVLAKASDQQDAARIKIISLIRTGRGREAIEVIRARPGRLRRLPNFQLFLALAYEADNQTAKAVELLDSVRDNWRFQRWPAYQILAEYLIQDMMRKLRTSAPSNPLLKKVITRWRWSDMFAANIFSYFVDDFKQYERGIWLAKHLNARNPSAVNANNLAWILLKADRPELREPRRALELARQTVSESHGGEASFLDTLALACFVNGDPQSAVKYEQQAADLDGGKADYYRRQLKKFQEALSAASSPASRPATRTEP